MNILNSIKVYDEDKIHFDKEVELVEQLEVITTNYSINVENDLKEMFKRLENTTSGLIARTTDELFYVLNRLPYKVFCNVINYLDVTYPGISFHMLMEAKQQKYSKSINIPLINEDTKLLTENNEFCLFYERIQKSSKKNLLKYLIQPMRYRLFKNFLDDDLYPEDTIEKKYLDITLIPRVLTEEEFLDKINKVAIISEKSKK